MQFKMEGGLLSLQKDTFFTFKFKVPFKIKSITITITITVGELYCAALSWNFIKEVLYSRQLSQKNSINTNKSVVALRAMNTFL